jgi:hypothetical protein
MHMHAQAAVESDAPRLELRDRGVSLTFLAEISGDPTIRSLTPGELVHGTNTEGQWERYDPATDPLSVRALTEKTGLSLIETAVALADRAKDPALLECTQHGHPYFGKPTHFVSYR